MDMYTVVSMDMYTVVSMDMYRGYEMQYLRGTNSESSQSKPATIDKRESTVYM